MSHCNRLQAKKQCSPQLIKPAWLQSSAESEGVARSAQWFSFVDADLFELARCVFVRWDLNLFEPATALDDTLLCNQLRIACHFLKLALRCLPCQM